MVARAFGLSLDFERLPPGAWRAEAGGEGSVRVRVGDRQEVEDAWSGRVEVGWEAKIDGDPFVAERGKDGDFRFLHGERSAHHLSADLAQLRCAFSKAEPSEWRVVLDSVLFSVALLRGREALHAGAVATEKGAIAIAAASGGGKSSLLAALLQAGLPLLSDDVVVLDAGPGRPLLAHPGAPVMTVPTSTAPLPGEWIATVGEESWVGVPTYPEPIPLAALILLDRRPGGATGLRRVSDPFGTLIGSLLHFPRTPDRERARFELAGAIASNLPIWRLEVDLSVDPATLAALAIEASREAPSVPRG
jgi:hypothetical protein